MTNHNDFPGFKVSPLDIFALLADSLAAEGEPAKRKEPDFDFDLKSHFDNLAAKGQEFFGGINIPGLFDERKDDNKGAREDAVPAVDVFVRPSGVEVLVGAPGVRQEDVEVLLEDTVLTLSIRSNREVENRFATLKPTNNWKGTEWLHTIVIPTSEDGVEKKIDEQNVTASVENGLIHVFVPYQAPKVVKVKVV